MRDYRTARIRVHICQHHMGDRCPQHSPHHPAGQSTHRSAGCRFLSGPGEAEGSGDGPPLSPGRLLHVRTCGGYPPACLSRSLLELVVLTGQDSSPSKTDSEILQ